MFEIRQKPNTEKALLEYLHTHTDADARYAYITLFTPKKCTRCEADINYSYRFLKQLDSASSVGIWTSYPDSEAAMGYLDHKGFGFDFTICDNAHDWTNFFSLSTMPLRVTLLLKIDLETGRLIKGGEISDVSENSYAEYVRCEEPLPFRDFNSYIAEETKPESLPFKGYSTVEIPIQGNKAPINLYPFMSDGELTFYDELNEDLSYFKENEDTIRYISSLNSSIREVYNLIDSTIIDYAEFKQNIENNLFFLMANRSAIFKKGVIYGSYSLPSLTNRGDNIAYYNSASFITQNKITNERKIIALDFGLDYTGEVLPAYVHEHAIFSIMPDGNVAIRSTKGYPNLGLGVNEWEGKANDYDTRLNAYYDDAYYLHVFDINTGKPIEFIGKPEDIFQYYKVGTFFAYPILSYHENTIAYTSGTSGIINIADKSTPNQVDKQFKVFDIITYEPKSEPCSIEYLKEMNTNVFTQRIIDLKIDKKYCYTLSSETGGIYFKKYKRSGKLVSEVCITNDTEVEDINLAIGKFENSYLPYYIRRVSGKSSLIRLEKI